MKTKYVNVTVRVRKLPSDIVKKILYEGDLELVDIVETGQRYGNPVYRYCGNDLVDLNLYYNSLITEE